MVSVNFTVWGADLDGGTRAIFEVSKRLAIRGHKVQITSLSGDQGRFPTSVPIAYATPPRVFRLIEPYIKLRYRRSMRCGDIQRLEEGLGFSFGIDFTKRLIEATPDCDINIATWYPTSVAVWFSGKGKPYFFLQDFYEQIESASGRRFFEAAMKLPFCFLANSNFTKEIVLKLQPDAKVHVANVGVDTSVFYPLGRNVVSDVRRPKVMAMIRGQHAKGDDILIEVLNRVNRRTPIHVLLIGSSRARARVLKALPKNAKIGFPYTTYEEVNDVELALLYSSADLFLFTSRAEGFGLPPLEAMACGTAVVTTDCKGNRDYAINDYNCLVAAPDDVQELEAFARKAVEDEALRNRLIQGGMETARRFSWDRTCDKFEEAFKASVYPL